MIDRSFYDKFAELCLDAARDLDSERIAGRAELDATLQRLFRVSHDLAGQAGMLELRRVCNVAAFTAARLRDATVNEDVRSSLIACVARLLRAAAGEATGVDQNAELRAIADVIATILD